MKTYGTVEVQVHSFLTSTLDEGKWSAYRTGRFTGCTHWLRGSVGLHSRYWRSGIQKNVLPLPENEPRFLGRPAPSLVIVLTPPPLTLKAQNVRLGVEYLKFRLFYKGLSQNCEKRLSALTCPSVRMEQLGSHWTDFHEIWNFSIFRNFVYKIQVSLRSDNNKRYFTWRPNIHHLSYLAQFFLEWRIFH